MLLRRTASASGLSESPISPKMCLTPICSSTSTRTSATGLRHLQFLPFGHPARKLSELFGTRGKWEPHRETAVCTALLVGDDDRNGRFVHEPLGGATEQPFTQAKMTISSHDDQVGLFALCL